jgi:hypothetical protein
MKGDEAVFNVSISKVHLKKIKNKGLFQFPLAITFPDQ